LTKRLEYLVKKTCGGIANADIHRCLITNQAERGCKIVEKGKPIFLSLKR